MQDINIKGKNFTHEEVCDYGKKSINKRRKILNIIGLSLLGVFLFMALTMTLGTISGTLVSEETGEVITFFDGLTISVASFFVYGTPGIILLVISARKAKNDPFEAGVSYLNKHFPYPVGSDGQIANLLQGDKHICLSSSPDMELIISSTERKFQIRKDKKYSRILDRGDIIDYEIRVDNEVVITSNSQTKKGFGKAVVGGVLFGGAGAIAGAIAGNKKSDTSQSQKEIHHYTFVLKVNDIHCPTVVAELPSLQMAEDVATTFAIFCEDANLIKERTNRSENVEIIEGPIAEKPKAYPQANTMDKFEEIKKYKELLDMGIISQEEFEVEKSRILK